MSCILGSENSFYSNALYRAIYEAAGVVFIADSNPERMDDNIESLTNLKEELRYWNIDFDTFPLVFQYNKRDLTAALSRDEM